MRRIPLMMIMVLLLSSLSVSKVVSLEFALLTKDATATVLEVIDGDALKVRTDEGQIALIRLLGVDATGFNDTFQHLQTVALGQRLQLSFDSGTNKYDGRWNLMYVNLNGTQLNRDLVKKGLAKANILHSTAAQYSQITENEAYAKARKLGIWSVGKGSASIAFGRGININTATSAQLQSSLSGVNSTLASAIITYRTNNPFNNMYELKFVNGFTKDIFDRNRSLLSVYTNINIADRDEIETLDSITPSLARKITDYRDTHTLNNASTLYSQGIISKSIYNKNAPFMGVDDFADILAVSPEYVVNINTASQSQLEEAGLTTNQAKAVIKYRDGYSYKTLEEINQLSGVNLTATKLNALEDNLHVVTDINTAGLDEIKSLFGGKDDAAAKKIYENATYNSISEIAQYTTYAKYTAIVPFVHTGVHEPEYLNINLATEEELRNLGLSSAEALKVYNKAGDMTDSSLIPIDMSAYDSKISLYTNINTASEKELSRLNRNMTSDLVATVISYRDSQPFGSKSEVSTMFSSEHKSSVYNAIKDFIVLR